MSVDLALLVFYADDPESAIAPTMIEIVPDQKLAERLFTIEKDFGRPVPKRFQTYTARADGEVRYGNTQTTPYGEPLRWLHATELLDRIADLPVDGLALNRAAWAYLKALPTNYGVALYWH